MKQIVISFSRVFLLAICLFYSNAINAYDFEVNGLYYNILSNNQVEITYHQDYKHYSRELVIPEKVKYEGKEYDVTCIGELAFDHCYGFTGSLIIPNSVTIIGNDAFNNCSGFRGTLTLSNSLTLIGDNAFRGCSRFTGSLIIPNSVTSIGDNAFANCDGFTDLLMLSNSLTSIGNGAFGECTGFSGSLSLPNSLITIGNGAFHGCLGLMGSLTLPNSIKTIGNSAFSGCKGFTGSLVIPDSVNTIGYSAFSECSGFTGLLIISNSVTSIEGYAFSGCSGFTNSLIIPNTVLSIGEGAFIGCRCLIDVTIPQSVASIGDFAFSGCTCLELVKSYIENPFTIDDSVFSSISASAKLEVPKGTKSKYQALSGWTSFFKEIIERDAVPATNKFEVGGLYFSKISNNEVEVCGTNDTNALYFSAGSLVIPETISYEDVLYKVVSIGSRAFEDCNYQGTLTIPKSIKTIGSYAFKGCNFTGSLSIPESVTTIGQGAFSRCNGFSGTLTIGNSVDNIGGYAFWGCSGFTGDLSIPNSVTTIGPNAFSGCEGFNGQLKISESLIDLKNETFYKCSGFNTLILPHTLVSIGNQAFEGCKGFVGSLSIPNSVTTIGARAFADCSGFSGSLIIPNSVTYIGFEAFYYCSGLTGSLKIPNSIKAIENGSFQGCSGLTGPMTIPNSVTSIGQNAFRYCTKLNKVISEIEDPFSIDETVFAPSSGLHETLEVPRGSMNKYESLSGWTKYFKEIVEMGVTPTTYSLTIKAIGSGYASYSGTALRDKTGSFTVNEGSSATISFSPDNGCRIKSLKVNSIDDTSSISNNQYTINNIIQDTSVEVEFEAIPVTYTLSITATGNGSTSYDGTTIRSKTSSFTVNEGTTVKISITPDNGYRIKSVKENNMVVTSYVSNGIYTINSLSRNTTVEVEFEEILQAFSADDVNYTVVSVDERTIRLAKGSYGITLEVPAKVNYQNTEWTVTGIDNGALANNIDLAAIIWHPEVVFTEQVSNPNLLLYVNHTQYAPSNIKNVVVNGNATSITLTDAASGNNFYCPQAFTAQKISYTHNYGMQTGIGEAMGWETIALPFDVQKVTHESKGEIVSFANWRSGDAKKPFWLMQLSASGWTMATGIKANTPYIISMPNNQQYIARFLLNGRVTFSAENVNVPKTENLTIANYSDRTFVPAFSSMEESNNVLALNVVNDIERVTGGSIEGSTFERNLRPVHPFEAYMTSTSSTRSIGIGEGMATGIIELISALSDEGVLRIYNLNGQLVKIEEGRSLDEVMKSLPAGVYVVNGKKVIIK